MSNTSEREIQKLRSSVDELAVLNQIANAVNLSMSIERITQVIIDACVRRTGASQGAVFLLRNDQSATEHMQTFVRQSTDSTTGLPFHLTESLVGWILRHRSTLLINDTVRVDATEPTGLATAGIVNLVCAPLLAKSRIIGAIVVINKSQPEGFSESDRRFLGIVGSQTAQVIENALLFEREQQLRALEEEMRTAARIQRGLLPAEAVETETFAIVGFSQPARIVGGDFYDVFRLNDGRLFLALGDIAGKGLPAALLAAKAQATMRALLLQTPDAPLAQLMATTNLLFFRHTDPGEYLTAFVGLYAPDSGTMDCINCGHCPPFLLTAQGAVSPVAGTNLILGAIEHVEFQSTTLSLAPGDTLVVFSDGVSECADSNDHQFGVESLQALLASSPGANANSIIRSIIEAASLFRGSAAQSDDVTLLALHRK
jgi:sigma-B regulation protein RsbU (phosphoserine phosphatase)